MLKAHHVRNAVRGAVKELTMSPRTDTLPSVMPKKKRKQKTNGEEKRPVGRPRVLAPELNTRFQIRCSEKDEDAWKAHAAEQGYSTGQWIRKVLNEALRQ